MKKTVLDILTDSGKFPLFGLPASEELAGRTARLPDGTDLRFDGELAVKCDDDLFLAEKEGRLLLVKELSEESLQALDTAAETENASALPEALEGWVTDFSCASGRVLTAAFGGGKLAVSPSPEPEMPFTFTAEASKAPENPEAVFPLQAVEFDEKRFILRFPETGETVVFNGRRFLLYAILGGRIAAGFVEIPPKER